MPCKSVIESIDFMRGTGYICVCVCDTNNTHSNPYEVPYGDASKSQYGGSMCMIQIMF